MTTNTDPKFTAILRNASQYRSLETAARIALGSQKPAVVVAGDNGKFWVVTVREADYLEKCGYEVMSAFELYLGK